MIIHNQRKKPGKKITIWTESNHSSRTKVGADQNHEINDPIPYILYIELDDFSEEALYVKIYNNPNPNIKKDPPDEKIKLHKEIIVEQKKPVQFSLILKFEVGEKRGMFDSNSNVVIDDDGIPFRPTKRKVKKT